jgi:hypothetical protein
MVNFAGPVSLAGRFVEVEIVEALAHSLRGRLAASDAQAAAELA